MKKYISIITVFIVLFLVGGVKVNAADTVCEYKKSGSPKVTITFKQTKDKYSATLSVEGKTGALDFERRRGSGRNQTKFNSDLINYTYKKGDKWGQCPSKIGFTDQTKVEDIHVYVTGGNYSLVEKEDYCSFAATGGMKAVKVYANNTNDVWFTIDGEKYTNIQYPARNGVFKKDKLIDKIKAGQCNFYISYTKTSRSYTLRVGPTAESVELTGDNGGESSGNGQGSVTPDPGGGSGDNGGGEIGGIVGCEILDDNSKELIKEIFFWIQLIAIALTVLLSMSDFIGAVTSFEENPYKKAFKRFIIRLVVLGIIILAPVIIELTLSFIEKSDVFCGIIE